MCTQTMDVAREVRRAGRNEAMAMNGEAGLLRWQCMYGMQLTDELLGQHIH